MTDFSGKKILVIGGSPREVVDQVRHYANMKRPENHGAEVATKFIKSGAEVTVINADRDSATTLLDRVKNELIGQAFDIVIQCANISSVKAAAQAATKLKIKKGDGEGIPLAVKGNIDFFGELKALLPATTILAGYTNKQEFIGDAELKALIENALPAKAEDMPMDRRYKGELADKEIIVTSGPTAQPISSHGDVISNFSTGTQGYAVAVALADMGAMVRLVTGPASVPAPKHHNINVKHVQSTNEMFEACKKLLPADGFVGVAAVADFGTRELSEINLAPNEPFTLQLYQMPDILRMMGTHESQRPSVVFGFAAETNDVVKYAKGKLDSKGADAICANQVGAIIAERGVANNQITYVSRGEVIPLDLMSKEDAGKFLAKKMAEIFKQKEVVAEAVEILRKAGGDPKLMLEQRLIPALLGKAESWAPKGYEILQGDYFKCGVTCLPVFNNMGRTFVVLHNRKEQDAEGNHKLGLIGGYLDHNEQPLDGLIREFGEEVLNPDHSPVINLDSNKIAEKPAYMSAANNIPKIILPFTYSLSPEEFRTLKNYDESFANPEFAAGVAAASKQESFGITILDSKEAQKLPAESFTYASQHQALLKLCEGLANNSKYIERA